MSFPAITGGSPAYPALSFRLRVSSDDPSVSMAYNSTSLAKRKKKRAPSSKCLAFGIEGIHDITEAALSEGFGHDNLSEKEKVFNLSSATYHLIFET